MHFPRSSGILLHPTSLPGRFGMGEIGQEAYRFIDELHACQQQVWQLLPLGPTGFGDSPYQCFSAFAGNPLLISLEQLVEDELLAPHDLEPMTQFPDSHVDYGGVISTKFPLLQKAYETYISKPNHPFQDDYTQFCEWNWWWVNDFALFMAVKEAHKGVTWTQWEEGIARREPDAMEEWTKKLEPRIKAIKFWQFLFYRQWCNLKAYANNKGIQIVGDIPIYVAHDCADVWANRDLFLLDEKGNPTYVAGVPPDYFSATGQLWGNPIYRWDKMAEDGYQWWIERFRAVFKQVDIVRLDHFRGFQAYWQVPAAEKTAINGEWIPGPGPSIFETLQHEFGELPIIAENLGLITDDVENLRKQFQFPGMRILQFAFSDPENPYLPHNYDSNTVAYTGTHDNDTTVGWWKSMGNASTLSTEQIDQVKQYAKKYINTKGEEIHWDFIRTLMGSVADMVVFPLQDILGLDSKARMNQPGKGQGNWQWRLQENAFTPQHRARLQELTKIYGRLPEQQKGKEGEE